jgi:hypothetical protein
MFALGGPCLGYLVERAGAPLAMSGAGLACALATTWYVLGRKRGDASNCVVIPDETSTG